MPASSTFESGGKNRMPARRPASSHTTTPASSDSSDEAMPEGRAVVTISASPFGFIKAPFSLPVCAALPAASRCLRSCFRPGCHHLHGTQLLPQILLQLDELRMLFNVWRARTRQPHIDDFLYATGARGHQHDA